MAAACGGGLRRRRPQAAAWRHKAAAYEASAFYFPSLTSLTATTCGRVAARQQSWCGGSSRFSWRPPAAAAFAKRPRWRSISRRWRSSRRPQSKYERSIREGDLFTPPEVTNTGPGFKPGVRGRRPGVWLRRTGGCVHARTEGGHFLYPFCPCVCVCVCRKTAVGVEKWVARKVARLPRRVEESTPRPKGRWVCEARRHALPACGSDIPRRITNLTPCRV
jgi:hypothetical protein